MSVTASAPKPSPSPTTAPNQTGDSIPGAVQAAIDRAIQEFDVQRDNVHLTSFTETQWFSTALGCPEPGRSYSQIINSGFIVELQIIGQAVTYHTDTESTVIQCSTE